MKIIRKFSRPIAVFCLLSLFADLLAPTFVHAVTGHSSMPEYRSFEPVGTTNMVNVFDGSFTYAIPLLDVPNGYPVTLSYHSNEINTEAQASWVGLGWTLNPGSINRVKRGFPDEFNGQTVKYHTKMPKNWTLTAGTGASFELFSKASDEKTKGNGLGLNAGVNIRFNNYQGFGRSFHTGASLAGMVSLNFSYSNGRVGFKPDINPAAILEKALKSKSAPKNKPTSEQSQGETEQQGQNQKQESADNQASAEKAEATQQATTQMRGIGESQISFGAGGVSGTFYSNKIPTLSISPNTPTPMPVSVNPYNGFGVDLKVEVGVNILPVPMDPEGYFTGTYVQQEYNTNSEKQVTGYMHSENALSNANWVMDYFTENDQMYDKKDKFLPVPFPNNDLFVVSGEALGGSFRAYRSEMGTYRQNKAVSETFTVRAGADINLPSIGTLVGSSNLVTTVGANLGGTYHMLESGAWEDNAINNYRFRDDNSYRESSNEKFVLRFTGDKTSQIDLTETDTPVRGRLTGYVADASISLNLGDRRNTERNLRSSYIEMHKQGDFASAYKTEQRNLKLFDGTGMVSYDRNYYHSSNPNSIGEVVTYNTDGVKYVYGLPINSRNEKEMQYSVSPGEVTTNGLTATLTNAASTEANAARKLGHESNAPYATQFLITQITSPDYIDRTLNGPSPDDFGNYTKFNYTRVAGGSGTWYGYRHPYNKVNFNYGSLSSNKDDMVSYNYGEKEIYFLHSIASRTHVAFFTTEDRTDGLSAKLGNNPSLADALSGSKSGVQEVKLKKLTRIDLYAIEDCNGDGEGNYTGPKTGARAIKSAIFKYEDENQALCQGIPNSSTVRGKLTLKKLWFEYGGIHKSKISPYEFHYQYPTEAYPSRYSALNNTISENQNPAYKLENTDRWGNYRDYDALVTKLGDLARFWPYADQNPGSSFDPAAWCLKRIDLPSGGQIHVQYEQHDYLYVQDKQAMVMVPLHASTDNEGEGNNTKKYFLDLGKLNIPVTMETAHQLFEPMKDERMYFNFLYRLIGDGGTAHYNTLNAEYIEGFARIAGYGVQDGKVYFVFKDINGGSNYAKIDHGSFNKRELPCKVCEEFYMNNRQGLVNNNSNALEDENQSDESKIRALASMATQITGTTPRCKVFNPSMSYVRLQLPLSQKGKLGGGIRVKRLMMYENGMLSGGTEKSLYGMEYDYTMQVSRNNQLYTVTSGVATNEPSTGRRENSLVQPLPRNSQSKFEAILYGQDMYDSEGPLGESLLPSPSVGYSQVKIKSIHSGMTGTGYELHEFYTCKDRPFKVLYTDIERACEVPVSAGGGVSGISAGYSRVAPHLTQGYSFVQNEMHGQVKRISKYAEYSKVPLAEELYDYIDDISRKGAVQNQQNTITDITDFSDLQTGMPVSGPGIPDGTTIASLEGGVITLSANAHATTSGWYTFREGITTMDENMRVRHNQRPGKEGEMLAESRNIYDLTIGANIGADVSAGVLITYPTPIPLPIPMVYLKKVKFGASMHESILRTHVTNKIIKYPAILKRVTNISDGIRHVSENMVYDQYSGNPVVVRSYDDFDQHVMKQDFMASWPYKNMRAKSLNEGLAFTGTFSTPNHLSIDTRGGSCSMLDNFVSGDFLEITQGSRVSLYHVDKVDYANNRLNLLLSGESSVSAQNGNASLLILRSGHTNQLNAKAGSMQSNNKTNYYTKDDEPAPGPVPTTVTQLVNLLNNNIPGSGSVTINKSSLPSGLQLVDFRNGICLDSINKFPGDIKISRSGNSFTVAIEGAPVNTAVPVNSEADPHPFVAFMNEYINAIWGQIIPDSVERIYYNGESMAHPDYSYCWLTLPEPWVINLLQPYQSLMFNNINGHNNLSINELLQICAAFKGPGFNVSSSSSDYRSAITQCFGTFGTTAMHERYEGVFFFSVRYGQANLYSPSSIGSMNNNAGFNETIYSFSPPSSSVDLKTWLENPFTSNIGVFSQNDDGYLTFRKYDFATKILGPGIPVLGIRFFRVDPVRPVICNTVLPLTHGTFSYNPSTNYIEFGNSTCSYPVTCLRICPESEETQTQAISASALTYSDNWSYDEGRFTLTSTAYSGTLNAYEKGFKGKWRVKDSYTYRSTASHDRNFNTGRFTLEIFNWENPQWNSDKWVKVNTVDQYGPSGSPLEEHNLMHIYSAAKYGYNNSVPVLVAQNARQSAVAFESFEQVYKDAYFEDGLPVSSAHLALRTQAFAHSGKYSMEVPQDGLNVARLQLTDNAPLQIRAWVRSATQASMVDASLSVTLSGNSEQVTGRLTRISSNGEWDLVEYTTSQLPTALLNTPLTVSVSREGLSKVYMDDIRIQPVESEMVCYVYDQALRLTTVLDDQHYALRYQYNPEGLLIRKLKETREGIKTLSETHYNTMKTNR